MAALAVLWVGAAPLVPWLTIRHLYATVRGEVNGDINGIRNAGTPMIVAEILN